MCFPEENAYFCEVSVYVARWFQDGPKTAQDGPTTAQDGPKTAPKSSKWFPKVFDLIKKEVNGHQEDAEIGVKASQGRQKRAQRSPRDTKMEGKVPFRSSSCSEAFFY